MEILTLGNRLGGLVTGSNFFCSRAVSGNGGVGRDPRSRICGRYSQPDLQLQQRDLQGQGGRDPRGQGRRQGRVQAGRT